MLDVNQAVNELLTKISNVLTNPTGAQPKDLQDIVSSLQNLKSVDKTVQYRLFDETIEKIKKAADSFDVPEKETKEIVDVNEDVEKEIKSALDDISDPREKAAKYNEIVNSQLDYTIKTIQEVLDLSKETEKTDDNVIKAVISDQTEKILSGIILSILGSKVKSLWQIRLSDDKTEKEAKELDLNERRQQKGREDIDLDYIDPDRPPEPEKTSDRNLFRESRAESYKSNESHDFDVDLEQKEIQKIGSFPTLSYKERQRVDSATLIPKTIEELGSATKARPKIHNPLDETDKQDKEIEPFSIASKEREKNLEEIESSEKTVKEVVELDSADIASKTIEDISIPQLEQKQIEELEKPEQENQKTAEQIETAFGQRQYRKDYLDPTETGGLTQYENEFDGKIESLEKGEKSIYPAYSRVNELGEIEEKEHTFSTRIEDNKLDFPSGKFIGEDGEEISYTRNLEGIQDSESKRLKDLEENTVGLQTNATADVQFEKTEYYKNTIAEINEIEEKANPDISRDIGAVGRMKLGKPGESDNRGWLETAFSDTIGLVQDVTVGLLGQLITNTLRIGPTEVRRFANKTSRWFNTIANAKSIMNGQPAGIFGGGEGRGLTDIEMSRQVFGFHNREDGEAIYNKELGTQHHLGEGESFAFKNVISSLSGAQSSTERSGTPAISKPGTIVPMKNAAGYEGDEKEFTRAKPEFASATEEIVAEGNFTTIKGISAALDAAKENIDSSIYGLLPKTHRKILKDDHLKHALDVGFNGEKPGDLTAMAGPGGPLAGASYIRSKSSVERPGEGPEYERFKERIAGLQHSRGCTGWLNVYPQRAIDFTGTQGNEKFVIPFQFEPGIAGDSKSADYSQVSTLGRSQAAQVYRRSTERNINLTLNYLVADAARDEAMGTSKSAKGMQGWTEEFVYEYVVRNLKSLVLPNVGDTRKFRLGPPIVQVWYGGLDSSTGSSASIVDNDNTKMNDIHPMFRTNWIGPNGQLETYRSLWVTKDVTIDYKEGIINRDSRNRLWVEVSLQLTEIAPSVVANQIFVWNRNTSFERTGTVAYDGGGMGIA